MDKTREVLIIPTSKGEERKIPVINIIKSIQKHFREKHVHYSTRDAYTDEEITFSSRQFYFLCDHFGTDFAYRINAIEKELDFLKFYGISIASNSRIEVAFFVKEVC